MPSSVLGAEVRALTKPENTLALIELSFLTKENDNKE